MSFQQELKEYLLANVPGAKQASGGKEIVCRCHMCMDSSDISKAHLYIGLGDASKPPLYNCFLCNSSGLVDGNFLRSMSIYNTDIINKVNVNNKAIMSKPGNQIYKDSNKVFILYNNRITQCAMSDAKLDYINKRLGTALTFSDILKLKIVLNIGDILESNRIEKLTRHPDIVGQLNNHFIGFISLDNAFINMRNLSPGKVHKNIDQRYINYNVFGKVDNSQRYYVIPTKPIDLSIPDPIKIYIAEGPFDILSMYLNVVKDDNRTIYTAICGKAYLNAVKYFVQTLGLINVEFHLCVDNDVSDYTIFNMVNYLRPFNFAFYLHRNTYVGEKDFGVSPDRITDTVDKL